MTKPGFQSKTQRVFEWFGFLVLLAATGFLLGAAIYFAVNPEDAGEDDGTFVAIFMLFLAGICAPFTYILLRRLMPRKAKHLSLTVPQTSVRRGEDLTARVDVLDPSKLSGTVDVTLRCTALYEVEAYVNGNRTAQTRSATVHEERFELGAGGPQEFRFRVPPDGPFSYEGTNFSMVWRVVARDPQPRRADRTIEQRLEVLP